MPIPSGNYLCHFSTGRYIYRDLIALLYIGDFCRPNIFSTDPLLPTWTKFPMKKFLIFTSPIPFHVSTRSIRQPEKLYNKTFLRWAKAGEIGYWVPKIKNAWLKISGSIANHLPDRHLLRGMSTKMAFYRKKNLWLVFLNGREIQILLSMVGS